MRTGAMLILAVIFLCGYSFAFEDGDWQYWNTEGVSWKFNKDFKGIIEQEFRFGDKASDFYYQHTDSGIVYSGLAKWLDLAANYRIIFEEKSQHWHYENRPHFGATVKYDLQGVALSDRNRFEFRDKEVEKDGWRYRNRLTVKLPGFTKLDIQPYASDEFFYDFVKRELNTNWLIGGISFKIIKNLKGDVYYQWQYAKSEGKWKDTNMIGTKLSLSF